ncbi:MAG: tryptophan 2,3-dioxygenase [Ottowia sp.]|nr:tryptophan 2,3-dioxygenase [Ottowia sp.]
MQNETPDFSLDQLSSQSTEEKSKVGWYNAQMNFKDKMSYADYLSLTNLLSAQHPCSSNHDEMLFIIQHQTSELWFKLVLHELHAVLSAIRRDALQLAFKILARVSRIFEHLIQAWNVLATMTPSDYAHIRAGLGAGSGFQSYQYRQIEFLLGNKNAEMLRPHIHHPEIFTQLKHALDTPSLYDEVIQLLVRHGFVIDQERALHLPAKHNQTLERAWYKIYRAPRQYWDLYQMAEKLVDIEDTLRQWRFRHVTTVERIIGFKTGTGGTSGVSYLRKMLDTVLFPELWQVRTTL